MIERDLGIIDYPSCWQAMRDFTLQRQPDTPDELWLLEHFPVFTQGDAGEPQHLLHATDIPIVHTDRGGQITYHAPGQLIAYPLIDLKRKPYTARELVTRLETALINTLKHYNIQALSNPLAPGIYINEAKVASLGLRIKNACSYHGLALNVDMDLNPFNFINPCGIIGQKMIHLAALIPNIKKEEVKQQLSIELKAIL